MITMEGSYISSAEFQEPMRHSQEDDEMLLLIVMDFLRSTRFSLTSLLLVL